MAANLDRSLDEILSEKKSDRGDRGDRSDRPQNRRRGGTSGNDTGGTGARNYRRDWDAPRDDIRKSYRDEYRDLDSEWVHDLYDDDPRPPRSAPRRRRDSPEHIDPTSSKLKVENIHYDLTQQELEDLFNRVGRVVRFVLVYDRAGRSEGIAYVTYEYPEDAQEAIREFDGASANGQPLRLTVMSSSSRRGRGARNPFDTAVMPSRPLSERITYPSDRARSLSPNRNQDVEAAASKGIDRYVPGARSRSPLPQRRRGGGGRRPRARREAAGDGGSSRGNNQRPRKTQEELDAEMEDYFSGGGANGAAAAPAQNETAGHDQAATDDIDMIE